MHPVTIAARWWLLLALVSMVQAAVHPLSRDTTNLCCSNQFVLHGVHCYRYFGSASRRAYFHAQKQCHRVQSSLVDIHSHSEEQFIVTLIESNSSYWIGLNDHDGPGTQHKEGVFKWGGGEVVTMHYLNWRSGEPTNQPHRDCVLANEQGWAMATTGCASTKLPFVCKRIACPEGLDLFDGACDIILTEEQHSSVYCTVNHLLLLTTALLLIILGCVLVWACARAYKMAANAKDIASMAVLDKPLVRTTNAVQDLYPT